MASPTRRPAGRRRILLTFSDQAVSSASNFVTGVAVARLAGVARFGDYMLTIMVWLIVVGVHRAVNCQEETGELISLACPPATTCPIPLLPPPPR